MEYAELGTIAKIAYTRYKAGGITEAQISELVTAGKITLEEQNFILGV